MDMINSSITASLNALAAGKISPPVPMTNGKAVNVGDPNLNELKTNAQPPPAIQQTTVAPSDEPR